MFPSWIRLIVVILLTLLLINLFLNFPKMGEPKKLVSSVAVLTPNRQYTCEVAKISDCTIWCYEMETATLLVLKPDNCQTSNGLKKGKIIRFVVENLPYHNDGSIPVKLLPLGGNK